MYGSLAHTGISWPLYAVIGLGSVMVGGAMKLAAWLRDR